jgi:LmbE family N-acetylglucosaminyl deacetylase
MPLDDAEIERALVVTAHPDDADFGSAGTVATWTDRGITVTYCIVTDGDAGGFDPDIPRSEIPRIRRAEQVDAAKQAGVDDVRFLGYPDGRLEVSFGLRRDISRVIRQVRPQRLLTQSPVRNWQRIGVSHPDHMATGEAALCAVYPDARNPFAHPELAEEGLEPWKVAEVWLSGHPQADHWVDVTGTYDRKLAAILAHTSQHPRPDEIDAMVRRWLTANAEAASLPDGRLAESFTVLSTA